MDTAFIIISTAVFAWLSWVKRDVALGLLVVLLPVYQIRFSLFGIPATLLEVYILVLCALWVMDVLVHKTFVVIPYWWLLALFACAGTVAVFTSVDLRAGLGLWKAYIIEPMLVYIVLVTTLRTREQLRRIEWGFIGLVLVISIIAVLQGIEAVAIPEPYASETPQRVTSIFPFPTAIGKLLGPVIGLLLPFLFFFFTSWHKEYKKRLIATGIVVVLAVLSLLLSVNRGALLGVAAAGLVLLFFSKRRVVLLSLVGLCIAGLFFVPAIQNEITDVLAGTDTSTDVRIIMWQGTWRLIQAHPIFGAGLGGFPVLYDQYRDAAHVELFPNPDNLLLTLWVEMGLLGVFTFILLLWVWIRASIRLLRGFRSEQGWLYGLGALGFLIVLLVHGIVDTPYFKNDLAVVFWVVFGVLVVHERKTITS